MTSSPIKGESAPLHVSASEKMRLQIGISWDTRDELKTEGLLIKTEKMVNVTHDIDLFCCIYNKDKQTIGAVTPDNAGLLDASGHIFHSGDNQTGRISGDDEYISLHMALLPENYHAIVFFALSHKKAFKQAENVTMRVADGISDKEQLTVELSQIAGAEKDGFIFAAVIRDPAAERGWTLKNISTFKADAEINDWGAEGAAFL